MIWILYLYPAAVRDVVTHEVLVPYRTFCLPAFVPSLFSFLIVHLRTLLDHLFDSTRLWSGSGTIWFMQQLHYQLLFYYDMNRTTSGRLDVYLFIYLPFSRTTIRGYLQVSLFHQR